MAVVYVNLHPNYSYSNIIIQSGYVAELKEYVANVEWLHWDFSSLRGNKPLLVAMGGWANESEAIERHLERTKVVLQRLQSVGAEIYIRNERKDDWREYIADRVFDEDEMYQIEIQLLRENIKEKWAIADIEKFQRLIDIGLKKGIDTEPLLNWLNDAKERLEECRSLEELRKENIKNLWH